MASTTGTATRRARVHHRDRSPQGVPHRSGARPLRDRHRRTASQRGSTPARPAARIRRRLHAPHLGDRVRFRARSAAGTTTRRRRGDGARRATDPVGTGPAARRRLHRQDRPARRPGRGDRGAAPHAAAPGRSRRSHAVLRLLADRHHDLTGLRTQAICRLHALLCSLIAGGADRLLSAERTRRILRTIHPSNPVEVERKRIALDLLGDVRRFDSQLIAITNASSKQSWHRAPR